MASRYSTLGVDSDYSPNWGIRFDEFVPDLRGERGIRRLREMATNDPICGAILSAMDLMMRRTPWRIEGGSDEARELVEWSLHHLDDASFQDFVSDALSFLPYGFSLFEIVARPPGRHPKGWVTLRRLAPRAQWTIDRFEVAPNGDVLGAHQLSTQGSAFLPAAKLLHFRTTSKQNDPAGVSVLRSAYSSWYFANRIKEIEAVAIERELNGIPLIRVPADYMAPEATDAQKAFMSAIKKIARDVKRNEQGYIILPSDPYMDDADKPSTMRLVDFELIASSGKRDIDTNIVIQRYQQDMARSALADFVLLGSNDRGSFALSKSKADLFLSALTGYVDSIAAVLNRRLIPTLCGWNGIDEADYPKVSHGTVAPIDLNELGQFLQRLTLAGISIEGSPDIENYLLEISGLPPANRPDGTRLDGKPPPDAADDANRSPDTDPEDTE